MKAITWNVNSIRARISSLTHLLKENHPDFVFLQELKCQYKDYPFELIRQEGYASLIHAQKAYNGVALLIRSSNPERTENLLSNLCIQGLPNFPEDSSARYIECSLDALSSACDKIESKKGITLVSVYVPNGQSVESEAYLYKLKFLDKLKDHLTTLKQRGDSILIAGDFNVAPRALDVYNQAYLTNEILCSVRERKGFAALCHIGLEDIVFNHKKNEPFYTWWDYRSGAFQKNHGLRIDHFLVSPRLMDKVKQVSRLMHFRDPNIDPSPSDHVPVMTLFDR